MSDVQEGSNKKIIYEILMASLSLIMVIAIILEDSAAIPIEMSNFLNYMDVTIVLIFATDYFARLVFSADKIKYLKENIIELISIVPFNSMFQALRFVRVIRVLRLLRLIKLFAFLNIFYKKADRFFKTNNFGTVLYVTCMTVFLGTIGISIAEDMKFGDALWWSFVTVTTVGYGDISPSTAIGRVIAVILMLIGIGFLGMFTGTIATFFIKKKERSLSIKEDTISIIKSRLDDFENLDQADIDDIYGILSSLKEK